MLLGLVLPVNVANITHPSLPKDFLSKPVCINSQNQLCNADFFHTQVDNNFDQHNTSMHTYTTVERQELIWPQPMPRKGSDIMSMCPVNVQH